MPRLMCVDPVLCRFSTSPTLVLVSSSSDLLGMPTFPRPLQNPYLASIKIPQTKPSPLLSPKPFFCTPITPHSPPATTSHLEPLFYILVKIFLLPGSKYNGWTGKLLYTPSNPIRAGKEQQNKAPPTHQQHYLPKHLPLNQSGKEIITHKSSEPP